MKHKILKSTSKWRTIKKSVIRPFYAIGKSKKVIIILGCQRSGTTLLTNVLDRINYTKVFGEFSVLSSSTSDKLRLNDLNKVANTLDKTSSPLIIMKPLVESQNALKLLESIPNSSIIWLYRQYKDNVLSNVNEFTSSAGYGNIKPLLESDYSNWRCENASTETIETLRSLYKDNSTEYDAGALFWYARNMLYFDQDLDQNEKVSLWKYEDFVQSPKRFIDNILMEDGLKKPNPNMYNIVSASSVGRANSLEINNNIHKLCTELMEKLDKKKVNLG